MADLPLEQLMDHLKRLKPFNAVLSRLLEVINTADASASDITTVLSGDPALAGKVLELVNSSFYGLPQRVSTVSQAVLILGTRSIQNLAFSFACLDSFRGMGGSLSDSRCWDHSVATAVAAQVVAEHSGCKVPEEAFIVGLLHDIGQLVMGSTCPAKYRQALAGDGEQPIETREEELIGISHSEASYLILCHWCLPERLCLAVRNHHRPAAPDDKLLRAVKLGEALALAQGRNLCELVDDLELNGLVKALGVMPSTFALIMREIARRDKFTEEFLRLGREPSGARPPARRGLDIVVLGSDPERVAWLCSLLSFFGHQVRHLPLNDPDALECAVPAIAIIDPDKTCAGTVMSVNALFKDKGAATALFSPGSTSPPFDASALSDAPPSLPFVFSEDKLLALL